MAKTPSKAKAAPVDEGSQVQDSEVKSVISAHGFALSL